MTPQARGRTYWRHRIIPALGNPVAMCVFGLIIGLLAGSAWVVTRPPEHEVETTFMLRPPPVKDVTEAVTASTYVMNRTKLYKSLITSDELAAAVAKRISGGLSATDLTSAVRVSDVYRTSLLTLTVTARSTDESMLIARGYAEAVPYFADDVEKEGGLSSDESLIVVVDGPRAVPTPGRARILAAGALFLGLLGIGLAYVVRRRLLVGDVITAGAATGLRPLANVDLSDATATDKVVARILIALNGQPQAMLVSPTSRDGAEPCAYALATAATRMGITAEVNDEGRPDDAELTISHRHLLDEACLEEPLPKGGLIIVARRYTTTKGDLMTVARIMMAEDPTPIGILIVKGRASRRRGARTPALTSGNSS